MCFEHAVWHMKFSTLNTDLSVEVFDSATDRTVLSTKKCFSHSSVYIKVDSYHVRLLRRSMCTCEDESAWRRRMKNDIDDGKLTCTIEGRLVFKNIDLEENRSALFSVTTLVCLFHILSIEMGNQHSYKRSPYRNLVSNVYVSFIVIWFHPHGYAHFKELRTWVS